LISFSFWIFKTHPRRVCGEGGGILLRTVGWFSCRRALGSWGWQFGGMDSKLLLLIFYLSIKLIAFIRNDCNNFNSQVDAIPSIGVLNCQIILSSFTAINFDRSRRNIFPTSLY
jgi:hypothetical protein